MAKTLGQIQQQISKLERQAEALRAKEVGGVVSRIRVAIEHYGLTEQDLFGGKAQPSARRKAKTAGGRGRGKVAKAGNGSATHRSIPPRYRDPASGATWAGRGSRPRWLMAALAEGRKLEDYLVQA